MKNIVGLILVFLIPFTAQSQDLDTVIIDDEVYTIVEKMPEFPGGQKAMFQFLAKNIFYPPEAKANNIQGKVFVNFTVDKGGAIINTRVLRGVHDLLDKEAVRVINSMPNWEPGEQRGHKVSVSYNLPISFKLGIHNVPPPTKAQENYVAGSNLLKKSKPKKAILYYTVAIAEDSEYLDAYFNRGVCYYQIREFENACKDWNKAIELGDEEAKVLVEKHCEKKD